MRALLLLLIALAAPLAGQAPSPIDSQTGGGDQVQRLRHAVLERWRAQVRSQLELTDTQARKLQATEDRFLERRQTITRRQRAVLQGLRDQLQSGRAANSDSLRRLLDVRSRNRAELAQLEQDEDREIAGYLTPVQRARYQLLRQRLQDRIVELRRERRGRAPSPE